MILAVFSAELRRMTDLTYQLVYKDIKMNNKIETKEQNIEITLDEMQLIQDDELKTICGGGPTDPEANHELDSCRRPK